MLESPTERFPAPILVVVQANLTVNKKTDPVRQTTLFEDVTPLLANTSPAAKRGCALLHHLDTCVLDLAMPFQTVLMAMKTTTVHLIVLFAG